VSLETAGLTYERGFSHRDKKQPLDCYLSDPAIGYITSDSLGKVLGLGESISSDDLSLRFERDTQRFIAGIFGDSDSVVARMDPLEMSRSPNHNVDKDFPYYYSNEILNQVPGNSNLQVLLDDKSPLGIRYRPTGGATTIMVQLKPVFD